MFSLLNKVKPCSTSLVRGWETKFEYPVLCNNSFFLFSPSFSKAILRTAELPSLCNVVSSIYQLFVPHFAMDRIYVYLFNLVPRVFSLSNMAAVAEDPGTCTQRTKTVDDWCILLRVHTCALIGLSLPKQKWWLPEFFVETENRV